MTDRLLPKKCPTKKKCFATEADAQPYLEITQAKDHPSRAALLGVYRCRACHWLHVGHQRGPIYTRTTRRGKHAPRFPQNT